MSQRCAISKNVYHDLAETRRHGALIGIVTIRVEKKKKKKKKKRVRARARESYVTDLWSEKNTTLCCV